MRKRSCTTWVPKSGDRFRKARLRRTPAEHVRVIVGQNMEVHARPQLERVAVLHVENAAGAKYLVLTMGAKSKPLDRLRKNNGNPVDTKYHTIYTGKKEIMRARYLGRCWAVSVARITKYGVDGSNVKGFDSLAHAKAEIEGLEHHYALHLLRKKR